MKHRAFIAAALLLSLAACGTKYENGKAENVYEAFDNQADTIDQRASNAHSANMKDALHDQADAIRAEGKARADAIDDSSINGMGTGPNTTANTTR